MIGIDSLKTKIAANDAAQRKSAKAAYQSWRDTLTTAERLRAANAPLSGDALKASLVAIAESGVPNKLGSRDNALYSSNFGHLSLLIAEDAPNKRLALQGRYIVGQVLNQCRGFTTEQRRDVMVSVISAYWGNVTTGLVQIPDELWHTGLSRQVIEQWAECLCPELLEEQRHDEMANRAAYSFALNSIQALMPAKPQLFTVKRSDDEMVYVRNTRGGSVGIGQIVFKGDDVTPLTALQYAEVQEEAAYTNNVASGVLHVVTPEDAATLITEGGA
ncbi:hypothetical protein [Cobetia crustatorum]|uniref:Uncharacterized protein n=1 Tax=Cobetia crustatorum TaxID=553385 RepID=A0A558HXH5_9GAMM|nr:hypothetical protein [Cobetia crustatorum]TVU73846.1 hypothetical protein FQP86_01910 [Cobetia crustatorum]